MTIQAREIIQYRGKSYSLYDFPLEPFKKQHPEFPFPGRCSAAWRGYVGHWKIEQDKLYLCLLGLGQHTMEEVFGHSEPVFAQWYSGFLKLGIVKEKHNVLHTYCFHEDVLRCVVKDGVIVSKQIVKEFDEYDFRAPGKYADKTILQCVIYGVMNHVLPVDFVAKEYVQTLVRFFKNDSSFKERIEIPVLQDRYATLSQNIPSYFLRDRRAMVTDSFVAIEKVKYPPNEDNTSELLSQLLEDILGADFSAMQTLSKKGFEDAPVSYNTILLNPDISYLEQAVFEDEDFSIPPHFMRKGRIIKLLKTFEINRLNSTIFEYEPVLVEKPLVINESVRRVNAEKFREKYGAAYDETENVYLSAMTQDELWKKYGYLLEPQKDV